MPLKVTFELSNRDLKYFRDTLKAVREGKRGSNEETVIKGASALVSKVLGEEVPDFVSERIGKLDQMIRMLMDDEWRLEGADRARVVNALAYFVNADDLIPDRVPGIGYLDDAIMVELAGQELRHELDAYEDFCKFRSQRPVEPDRIEERRASLQGRMRRRRRSERSRRRSVGGGRSPLNLW